MNRFARRLFTLVYLPLTACSDAGVTKFNTDPTAEISSHSDGDTVREGYAAALRGTVGDANHAIDELRLSWLVDGVGVCPESAPDADGLVTCTHTFAATGGEILLEVRDPEGGSGSARVTVDVEPTDAPEAEIAAPHADGVYYSDQLVTLEGRISDAEDDASGLTVTWESSVDGPLTGGFDEPDSEGGLLGAVTLSEGEHFLTLTATDSTGKQGRDSTTIRVGPPNSSPSCEVTSPADGASGQAGGTVRFEATVSDADVPSDWLEVTWTSDKDGPIGVSTPTTAGEVVFSYSGLTVDTHTITLMAVDEVGATCSDLVVYSVGTPPTLVVTSPSSGDTVNESVPVEFAATVSDNEDPPTDIALSWSSDVDGAFSAEGADASGAVSFSWTPVSSGTHTVTVTATDTDGLQSQATLDLAVNQVPTAPSVSLSPDPAYTADTLTATATGSTDPDGSGPVTYTYAWAVDGVASSVSTAPTYPSSDTQKHSTYRVTVTPSDGTGDGASTATEVTVSNSAPVLAGPTLSASSVRVGDVLSCAATATDADPVDTPTVSYLWSDGSVGSTYTVTTADAVGATVTCTATADDGDGGTDSGSASATVANTAPSVSTPSLAPTTVYTSDTLTANVTTSDAEGDTLTVTYDWYVDGSSVQDGADNTLSGATWFDKGQDVYVIVTADDGTDTTAATSATVTVSNTPPGPPTLAIEPSDAIEGDDLYCDVTTASVDDDGDVVTYTMSWTVDAAAYTSAVTTTWTDDTADGADVGASELWTCTAVPDDGDDAGTASTASVTVACDDGSDSSCPGLDCLDLITSDPTLPDDIYWIDPTGSAPYEVWCDMTTDGGGWTLVMKAINDNFAYNDAEWTSSTLRDETDLSLTVGGTAKYQSFNEVPFTELRSSDPTMWTTDNIYTYGTTQTSALDAFSSTGFLIASSRSAYFNSRVTSAFQSWGCTSEDRYGVNLYDALGCTYIRVSGLCDHNGGARFGNRVNRYGCSTCGDLNGQGWAPYSCSRSDMPSYDTGPGGLQATNTINELMWVR